MTATALSPKTNPPNPSAMERKVPFRGLFRNWGIGYLMNPICFPRDELLTKSYVGEKTVVAGWGKTENTSSVLSSESFSVDCEDDVKYKAYITENNNGSDSDEMIVSASSSVNVTETSNHRDSHSPNKGVPISPLKRERAIKSLCSEKCKLQCAAKFSEEESNILFSTYLDLGDLGKQQQYIANSIVIMNPKYIYVQMGGTRSPRRPKNTFYFYRKDQKVRMCKVFFRNTLAINDSPIRTVLDKINKVGNVLLVYHLRAVDPSIKDGIKQPVESIPKIESHSLQANTSRHLIEGSISITGTSKYYVASCKEKKIPFPNYTFFYRLLTQELNISFFVPKKYLDTSKKKKNADKINGELIVAVYALQEEVRLPN
ncbi:hypothetical protein PR048_014083 [Dryococelus australis]|uniref:Uncharacterized protein n=1 Tax=Dryococelus australis TaxID=614101 RepID=A0ABQ9HTY3_9NEOP|nr:hypothetical protein PR048_014083 [Dryococelus australis]